MSFPPLNVEDLVDLNKRGKRKGLGRENLNLLVIKLGEYATKIKIHKI